MHLLTDGVIVAWLDEKTGKSRGWKTPSPITTPPSPCGQGGETDDKELEVETSKVLAAYLRPHYGEDWLANKAAAVWISYAHNHSCGRPLSVQTLEQIARKHIGTSMFHTLRHTAGLALDDLGVPTSEVQAFLRYKNISTTNTYLKRQKRARNQYGQDLE